MCIIFLMENSNNSLNIFKLPTFKKSTSFPLVFLTKDKYYKFYNTTTWHLYVNNSRHYFLENKEALVCVLHEK
jgi:hypothetical protein